MTPLRDVVAQVSAATKQLNALDTRIAAQLQKIETLLRARKLTAVRAVKLPDGSELAWSGAIRSRQSRRSAPADRWRLVIRDVHDDGAVVDLLSSARSERSEAITCGALGKLIALVLDTTEPPARNSEDKP